MGNCAVTHEAVSWADNDGEWEVPSPSGADGDGAHGAERKVQMINEVTIRISKRQLQELIDKRADDGFWKSRGTSASELLADIMNAGEVHHNVEQCRAAHWKPALKSIPEAVEP